MIETNDADRIGTQPDRARPRHARPRLAPGLRRGRVHRVVAAVGPHHPAGEHAPAAAGPAYVVQARDQPLGGRRRSGRCRRRAARPGRARGSAPARCPAANPPAPPVFARQVHDVAGRRSSRRAARRCRRCEALSTTTISRRRVGLRAQRGEGLHEQVAPVPGHDDGDDPGTSQALGHGRHPTATPAVGPAAQQALDRSVGLRWRRSRRAGCRSSRRRWTAGRASSPSWRPASRRRRRLRRVLSPSERSIAVCHHRLDLGDVGVAGVDRRRHERDGARPAGSGP